ncbi:hypothetical protein BH11PSE11_BH11PSE11_38020 [soil metagenome]
MASRSHYQAFIIATLGLAAAALACVAAFNVYVDPFQQYHLATSDMARYPRALQRYINPGLAKHADYDFVITGSSLMENYSLQEVNRLCQAKSINLSFSAMAAYEQRKILEVALRHRSPKRVMMTLDFNSFAPDIDQSLPEIGEPLPLYLYDDNPFNDFHYLLSGDVSKRSLGILLGARWSAAPTDYDRAWSWDTERPFSRQHALAGIDPAQINRRFKQGPRTTQHMRASFEANIANLIESHPATEFNLIFPPYSILVWADFVQRDQLELSLDFKKYVLQRLQGMPNVRLFDMQWDESITHQLDLYSDIYHFNPAINRKMLESVCGSDTQYRMIAATSDEFIARLRRQSLKINPAKFMQEALATQAGPGQLPGR